MLQEPQLINFGIDSEDQIVLPPLVNEELSTKRKEPELMDFGVTNLDTEEKNLEKKEPKQGSIEHAEWQSKMSDIHGLANLIVGKHRHGSTGTVHVEFEGMYTKFKDLPKN